MNKPRTLIVLGAFFLILGVVSAPGGLQAQNDILLGRPTDQSITVNVIPDQTGFISFDYGTASGVYDDQTPGVACTDGEPVEVVIDGLSSNTRYYYGMLYSAASSGGPWSAWTGETEHTFHTQRAVGDTFVFTITSDSHVDIMLGNAATWQQTLSNVAADNPDFHLDLGDTFAMDNVTTVAGAENAYRFQRPYFAAISHSAPVFLAIGNHEQEEAWHLDDTGDPATSQPVMGANARKKYYLNPVPDGFYTGNSNTYAYLDGDQLIEDYFAWHWGDALFIVLDPYWYTTTKPYLGTTGGGETSDTGSGDRWDWTLGEDQFNWFKATIEGSSARYKFVFAHHMVGGSQDYVREGATPAHMFEWGGENLNGTWGFTAERPEAQWGPTPVHQLMMANGVSGFYHGHDHQYAYEERDDIVYQCLPAAGFSGNGFNLYSESDPYTLRVLPSPGHLRVTVSPAQATVDYVQTSGGGVAYSYDIVADSGENDPPVVTGIPDQTIVEGGTFAAVPLDDYVSDVDNTDADMVWTTSGNTDLSVDITDRVATITPPAADWIGAETITFTATDPGGLDDDDEATFTVLEASAGALQYVGDLGTAAEKTIGAGLAITTGAAVAAGDDIIVAFATYGDPDYTISVTDDAGNTYEEVGQAVCYTHGRTYLFAAYNVTALPAGSDITITHTEVEARAAVASVFRGLVDVDPLDQSLGNPAPGAEEQASGTAATAGPTGTTAQPYELLIGAVGTEGPVEDTAGTWQNAFTAGPRAGTTGGDDTSNWTVSLGYRIVSAVGAYTAQKDGMTDRYWGAIIATFKAGAPGPNLPPEAEDDSAATTQNTPVNINVLVNDSDGNGDPLSVTDVTVPGHGTAEIQPDDTITYTPAAGYVGVDSFDYEIGDGNGGTDTATVSVTITLPGVITHIGDIGTALTKEEGGLLEVVTDSAVEAGDTIIVSYATSPNEHLEVEVTDDAGNTYYQVALARNWGYGRTYIFAAYDVTALPLASTITITSWDPDGAELPTAKAAVVSVFRGLADGDPLDQSLGNPLFEAEETISGTSPYVGPVTTTQADELLFGAIGTEGPVEDAPGAWQNSFVNGPRVGTTGGEAESNWTLSVGHVMVSEIGTYTAEKDGITDRCYAAVIATFRAGAPPVNTCLGDFNSDGSVDEADLALFAGDFCRTDCTGDCEGECEGTDNDVDGSDLAELIADFGRTDCLAGP